MRQAATEEVLKELHGQLDSSGEETRKLGQSLLDLEARVSSHIQEQLTSAAEETQAKIQIAEEKIVAQLQMELMANAKESSLVWQALDAKVESRLPGQSRSLHDEVLDELRNQLDSSVKETSKLAQLLQDLETWVSLHIKDQLDLTAEESQGHIQSVEDKEAAKYEVDDKEESSDSASSSSGGESDSEASGDGSASSGSSKSSSSAQQLAGAGTAVPAAAAPVAPAAQGTNGFPRVRRACAKMLVRAGLRCSCHFSYVRDCPSRGVAAT